MPTIDYYFSVLSDWAYFGGERLEALARKYGAPINTCRCVLPKSMRGPVG
jgi:2-hydroxychromene-2-carboxylate isomerase